MTDQTLPHVSVLVVAYHSTDFIRQCVDGIAAAAPNTPYEILMIDNGGGDTEAFVRAELPQVRIVPSEGNIGFGAGNNRCAAHARGQYMMLVNPDAVPQPGALDRLVAFARAHPEAAAWGGRSYDTAGKLDPGNFLPLPTPMDFVASIVSARRLRRGGLAEDATEPGPVDVLNGGFMMVRADVWREIGGFDESFFLYSEEVDMFKRIRERGYAVLVDPGVAVVHDAGSGHSLSSSRIMFMTTGRMHYARKHFTKGGALVTGWAIWLAALKYQLLGSLLAPLLPKKRERLTAVSRAWAPVVRERRRWWAGYPAKK
ncbi:glycosyltransferase family 2 protein [Sphingomonas elodea]|uniref:Putative rhamnosyl transferase n=2 Tax=Sphingomonas elodea TaxID=179878 RepID=Q7X2M5_SPHEL|nr:glycosyltransferase family 2 protein [Sphingomonas elodea]AAP57684.1 putative rhamnosyl transferase [Sphingomonas elodea ATCC 31461]